MSAKYTSGSGEFYKPPLSSLDLIEFCTQLSEIWLSQPTHLNTIYGVLPACLPASILCLHHHQLTLLANSPMATLKPNLDHDHRLQILTLRDAGRPLPYNHI